MHPIRSDIFLLHRHSHHIPMCVSFSECDCLACALCHSPHAHTISVLGAQILLVSHARIHFECLPANAHTRTDASFRSHATPRPSPTLAPLLLFQSTLPSTETSPHDCTFEVDVTFQGDACVDLRLDLLRGRQGAVTLRVTELAGRVHIRMRSLPSPHYTASFVTAPLLTMHARSLFEGREMPHFDGVLTHLIRRAVERNHTLPAAKIR